MALTNCGRTRVLLADDDLQMLGRIDRLLAPDFEMPRLNGLEAVRQIRGSLPGTKCIFLTLHDGNDYRLEAQAAGGEAYVLKSAARRELNQVIHRVTGRSEKKQNRNFSQDGQSVRRPSLPRPCAASLFPGSYLASDS